MVHRSQGRADASRTTGGDHQPVNALQQLIQDWIDAEPGRSIGVLATRGKMPRNTLYAIMDRSAPASMPRETTLRKLAAGLGEPLEKVKRAAETAAGYGISEMDPESQEIQAWVAMLGELPPQRRAELWEIGRLYLRRVKDEP